MTSEIMTPELADYRARVFVNGMRRHGKSGKMEPASGEFASRFAAHPWCREAVCDGWGRELRTVLIAAVKHRLMTNQTHSIIEDLMPSKEWVSTAKQQAARYDSARVWREAHIPDSVGLKGLLKKIAAESGLGYDQATGEIP